jgi:hypothetical protein
VSVLVDKRPVAGLLVVITTLLFMQCAPAAPHQWPGSSQALDQQMAATLQVLGAGNLKEARVLARQMASTFPRSALAQLLSAELESSAAHQDVLAAGFEPMSQELMALLLEARVRLQNAPRAGIQRSIDQLPSEIVQLGKHISALLVIDLTDSTLSHLTVNDGMPTLMQQFYVGSGKAGFGKRVEGDNKTPLGIYNINGERSDASLPDLYGAGALTLDYPNALDRHLGRTGSGIWLHGVPHNQRNRPPRSSEGCVTMSNDHFLSLQSRLPVAGSTLRSAAVKRSPALSPATSAAGEALVLLTHSSQWTASTQRLAEQERFQHLFERYQQAWRQGDIFDLLSLYESSELAKQRLAQITSQAADGLPADVQWTLDSVDKGDISIFRNPALATGDRQLDRAFLVMRAQFGQFNEQQLTLYWAQAENGAWQVVIEQWEVLNS